MPYLLGDWSEPNDPIMKQIDGEASTWKSNLTVVRAIIDIAAKTRRFNPE